jgi:hypothetical protein
MADRKPHLGAAGWLAAALLGACWWGSAVPPRTAVTAEIKQPESAEPFLAGDERSIPVLKEIAATVKQIDARLERIEKFIEKSRSAPRQP